MSMHFPSGWRGPFSSIYFLVLSWCEINNTGTLR
uniref:Uncharacterized protein n=1 Tax=Setaria viridis TaxID=4556 RepID=A0A4U6VX32_SETVI|nr:hypothetical protein SEVIR_2G176550v2 [Setaria viridis]